MNKSFYVYSKDIYKLQCASYESYDGSHFKSDSHVIFNRMTRDEILFSHPIVLNNHGYRGGNFNIHHDDVFRIIAIGDSFTSGFDCQSPWPTLLQDKLKNQSLNGKSVVEVLNLGIPGAGPSNWITLLPLINILKPDLIIMGFLDNILNRPKIKFYSDSLKKSFFCIYDGFDESYCKGLINENLSSNMNHSIIKEMHDYFVYLTQDKKTSPNIDEKSKSYFFSQNKKHVENMMDALKQNCKIILAQIPSEKTFDVLGIDDGKDFLNKFQSDDIKVINLQKEMSGFKKESLYLEHHWNNLGNEVMANILKNAIIQYIES